MIRRSVSGGLSRAVVVAEARAMIADEGLGAVTLRRLAARLGVTAPALYAYVEGKRDLLRGVAELEFAQLITTFEAIDEREPLRRLRCLSRAYIDQALAEPELFRTMFLFPPALALVPSTGEELAMATRSFQISTDAVRAAMEAGVLRTGDPVLVALTLWTTTHGVADVLLLGFPFDDATRELLIDTVIDNALAGLAAPTTSN